ncbi:T9SS type A sorting domain-containing protein [Aquimarina agarivorans]|uniref:T9SS type A sorting domain-containing protein n=1 Tax=Aquimarina agarivorans TaxID=980584 RepID=UPI000248FCE1|nr:T9SS type A sorting domain-containing protein [Aquimarina agarivorans]
MGVHLGTPYYYYIKNVETGKYLEIHKGYTETDIKEETEENVFPFLADQEKEIPRWILRKGPNEGEFKILPAANEKQSVLFSETEPKLNFHKKFNADGKTRSIKEPNDFGIWKISPLNGTGAKQLISENEALVNTIKIYPNPAKEVVSIFYKDITNPVAKIKIYDATGGLQAAAAAAEEEAEEEEEINTNQEDTIDVSNLVSGIYFVKFPNTLVKKLIIE